MADDDDQIGTLPVQDEPLFDAALKKKKKKKKLVAFEQLEAQLDSDPAPLPDKDHAPDMIPPEALKPRPASAEDPAQPPSQVPSAAQLDLGDLQLTKKDKSLNLDLHDQPAPVDPNAKSGPDDGAVGADEFADLKKKKKNRKKAFDLEAFERELAEVEEATAKPPPGDHDDEAEDAPKDGLFDGPGLDAAAKSKAHLAAEKKAWIKEPDRDYSYDELLGRFYQALFLSHPSLSGGGAKKRYTLAPPSVHREGNKRSIWANVADICKKMHRQPEHVIQFLFAELGTSGSVDGNGNLVIKGRFQQKQIENVLRRYIVEYVTCKTCKSPDTLLEKDNRLYFVTCESCGSKRSVSAIKTGFSAQIGKRKAQRTG